MRKMFSSTKRKYERYNSEFNDLRKQGYEVMEAYEILKKRHHVSTVNTFISARKYCSELQTQEQ
jgi:hypothetical protein